MFALEAVGLTGLGDAELQCYSFSVPETVPFPSVREESYFLQIHILFLCVLPCYRFALLYVYASFYF